MSQQVQIVASTIFVDGKEVGRISPMHLADGNTIPCLEITSKEDEALLQEACYHLVGMVEAGYLQCAIESALDYRKLDTNSKIGHIAA
jgi:aerobic-type carbon monoxide dehydrogenase small subunit (CoxS/CutS family)